MRICCATCRVFRLVVGLVKPSSLCFFHLLLVLRVDSGAERLVLITRQGINFAQAENVGGLGREVF